MNWFIIDDTSVIAIVVIDIGDRDPHPLDISAVVIPDPDRILICWVKIHDVAIVVANSQPGRYQKCAGDRLTENAGMSIQNAEDSLSMASASLF